MTRAGRASATRCARSCGASSSRKGACATESNSLDESHRAAARPAALDQVADPDAQDEEERQHDEREEEAHEARAREAQRVDAEEVAQRREDDRDDETPEEPPLQDRGLALPAGREVPVRDADQDDDESPGDGHAPRQPACWVNTLRNERR